MCGFTKQSWTVRWLIKQDLYLIYPGRIQLKFTKWKSISGSMQCHCHFRRIMSHESSDQHGIAEISGIESFSKLEPGSLIKFVPSCECHRHLEISVIVSPPTLLVSSCWSKVFPVDSDRGLGERPKSASVPVLPKVSTYQSTGHGKLQSNHPPAYVFLKAVQA